MKLHVGNLPFSVGEEELKALFADYNAEEVSLIKDKFSGRSKGFGFVTISDDEESLRLLKQGQWKTDQKDHIEVSAEVRAETEEAMVAVLEAAEVSAADHQGDINLSVVEKIFIFYFIPFHLINFLLIFEFC